MQLVFDREIKYCAFGVTLWRNDEINLLDGDTAVVKVLNATNQWIECLDLLSDITLPSSRKDIVRFDVQNIYGLMFDVTSVASGDRNKGRLCIDNISFTNDVNYSSYLPSFYEPIVVRSTFYAPNSPTT